jgi:hypothetical protein
MEIIKAVGGRKFAPVGPILLDRVVVIIYHLVFVRGES